ncbi:MAG: TonB-dependent receptor [Acidobacteriales bacterium 13_2_20CM_2_55_5]|nr:MAG: TonB-dependent receptor [Acidobacteriales bacterium 13_2_20CM_2_55_5]
MSISIRRISTFVLVGALVSAVSILVAAQSLGSAGTIQGKVVDSTGAVIPNATVDIKNPVTGFERTTATDSSGLFVFRSVPQNSYHLAANAQGFGVAQEDVDVRTSVPIDLTIMLKVATSNTAVEVTAEAADLLENDPSAHTDVDSGVASRIPLESNTSALSQIITYSSPGVVADSNGFFHPLGDHAQTSFSLDNQPISDQQSRVYSNQISANAIQSMELITGVPSAEYGDKSSLVAVVTTKSGLGQTKPSGSVSFDYGSFGSSSGTVNLGVGNSKYGNFFSLNGLRTGRFLDPPEFQSIHNIGNSETFFDRADFQPNPANTLHLDLFLARSWFQAPNSFDQAAAGQDQRQQMKTFNVAPGWTHLFSSSTLLSASAYIRQDHVQYFPSANLFSDQPETVSQNRRLQNSGVRVDISHAKGKHNIKAGFQYSHTALSEFFNFGITDPTVNPVCLDSAGNPVLDPTITDPSTCSSRGYVANPGLKPGLVPFDLTRSGSLLLSEAYSLDPRLGLAYHVVPSNTILRFGYAHTLETPYNENLLLSSAAGQGGLAQNVFDPSVSIPLRSGRRNQYNAGFQQAFGRYLVVDGDYFWKYTDNAYDFNTLEDTPIAFPISWRKSKLDGFSFRISMPEMHGFRAYTILGHTRARYFNPETGGLFFDNNPPSGVFRIDHDQAFQQTTNLQYRFFKRRDGWAAFTWRYDSGLVNGSIPDYATALTLTADQQAAIGLFCGNVLATLNSPITSCSDPNRGALRVQIPADGTENDDKNPPRISPRHLFDMGLGFDNVMHTDRYKMTMKFTVVNLTNKEALYNFLSTFSGTHFVTPRSYTAGIGFTF